MTERLELMLRRWSWLLVGATALALVSSLYVADLVSWRGAVARGTVVAGQQLGGLSPAEAERRLRRVLEPRAARPLVLTAADKRARIDPAAAGLAVDWPATMARLAEQPTDPLSRLASLVGEREVEPVTTVERSQVAAALGPLAAQVQRAPAEGAVRFDGLTPVVVDPVAGRRLDVQRAVEVVVERWLDGTEVALPVAEVKPTTGLAEVHRVLDTIARPAVSAPVRVVGEAGTQADVAPEVIARALSFRPDPASPGLLVPKVDVEVVAAAVRPALARSERPARDARVSFPGGVPAVTPAQSGRLIDYPATLGPLPGVLTRSGDERRLSAVYVDRPVTLTTEALNAALAAGEISSFTTGGFARDSGQNIRRAAEMINGQVVEPGEVFSLNAATNPRDASNGFVEAGIIEDGRPARGVGGGVSQVATTLYNAAYFAGMTDVEHKEHSYYIGRYPAAREATVFDDVIDLKFRNDGPGPVIIQTLWTPSSLTVRMLGQKVFEVTSQTGPRTRQTGVPTVTLSGSPCSAGSGAPGFTTTDTRTVRDLRNGQVRTQTRTVRYEPSPTVVCTDD